jgi:hypothetical protein
LKSLNNLRLARTRERSFVSVQNEQEQWHSY